MKTLRDGIELYLLKLFVSFFSSFNDRTALKLGRILGQVFFVIARKRRQIALQNMRFCGIGKSDQERMRIIRRMFHNFGMTAAEFSRIKVYTREDYSRKLEFVGFENAINAYRLNRGVIFLSGHFDNWEILIQAVAVKNLPASVVVRQQHNLKTDRFLKEIRSKNGLEVITAETQPLKIVRAFKKGRGVAVLLDVYGGREGIDIPLFGHEVSTLSGAVDLAVKNKIPIIISFIRRKSNGDHIIEVPEAIMAGEDDSFRDSRSILRHYHQIMEGMIRRYPHQWLWTHKRFKGLIDYK